jgi:hypothetical protein
VAARLATVDPAANPFTNIWYVDRFVNWIAHNWGAENPHHQYSSCITGLEKMLNWSFAHGLSLVDWRRTDFENYAEFVVNPSPAWTVTGPQPRYVQEPGVEFEHWSINVAAKALHELSFKKPKAVGLSFNQAKMAGRRCHPISIKFSSITCIT